VEAAAGKSLSFSRQRFPTKTPKLLVDKPWPSGIRSPKKLGENSGKRIE
jgi:hypothetical protein